MSSPNIASTRPEDSSVSPSAVETPSWFSGDNAHALECRIQRALQMHPSLKFTRLVVHQCPEGVLLDGLLASNEQQIDLCALVNDIAGVKAINRVVTQAPTNIPR